MSSMLIQSDFRIRTLLFIISVSRMFYFLTESCWESSEGYWMYLSVSNERNAQLMILTCKPDPWKTKLEVNESYLAYQNVKSYFGDYKKIRLVPMHLIYHNTIFYLLVWTDIPSKPESDWLISQQRDRANNEMTHRSTAMLLKRKIQL